MGDNEALQPNAHANEINHEQGFDFFGLPAELRNEIYSMLTEDTTIKNGYFDDGEDEPPPDTHITILQKKLLNPLLLNRQLKEEYEQEVNQHQTLVIQDNGQQWPSFEPGGIMSSVTKVNLRLVVECSYFESTGRNCDCVEDVGTHMSWIQPSFGMINPPKQLSHLVIEVRPYNTDTQRDTSWLIHGNKAIEKLQGMPVASEDYRIEVYPAVQLENRLIHTIYDDKRPPIGRWSRANGWQDA
jgi:hypothetical protein